MVDLMAVRGKGGKSKSTRPAARAQDSDTSGPRIEPSATLRQLLNHLGGEVIQVRTAPRGLDIPVGEPLIADRLESQAVEPAAIVLGVGIAADSVEARKLITEAGAASAAAVALKLRGRDCQWIEDAEAGGVAVLIIRDEMGWSQLNSLLSLTIPSLGQTTTVPGLASVPLGDLFSLANAIAAIVGGAITIEDPRARVLAYSTIPGQTIDEVRRQIILGRTAPDTASVRDLYKRLMHEEGVIRVEALVDLEMLPRLVAPIRAGKDMLGTLWAVEGEAPLGPEAESTLTEAARLTAVHMIHARSARDVERQMRGDLLRSLLEGRGDADTASTRLRIERNAPIVVLAFELTTDDALEETLHRERLVDLVATYLEAFRFKAACAAIGRTVYGLLVVQKPMKNESVMRIARDIHTHAEAALNVPLRVAVSSIVTDLRKVPDACQEAERVLRVLGRSNSSRTVASIDDVRSHVTLVALEELAAQHPDLRRGVVQEIAKHDEQKGTSFLQTLQAYVDSFGDMPRAASRLGVHRNTFRYRLQRLIDLFDVNIEDPEERLVIEFQLRILKDAET